MGRFTKDINIVSSIDTLQTKDRVENRKMQIDIVHGQTQKYINDGIITTRWSPNYKKIITRLTETEKEIGEIYKMATVINVEEVKMNRIDIHTDIDMEFEEIDKLLDLLFLSIIEGARNNIKKDWIDKNDLKKEAYWFGTQYLELNFYNKKKEAKDKGEKYEYPTRLEIRFKKIKSQDKKFHIDKAIGIYKEAIEKVSYSENTRIKLLCSAWDKFIIENPKATLTHFVIKYEKEIHTKKIMEGIYKHVGLKGQLNSWIKKFRQGYKLELITESELKELVKRINISLKRYKNN